MYRLSVRLPASYAGPCCGSNLLHGALGPAPAAAYAEHGVGCRGVSVTCSGCVDRITHSSSSAPRWLASFIGTHLLPPPSLVPSQPDASVRNLNPPVGCTRPTVTQSSPHPPQPKAQTTMLQFKGCLFFIVLHLVSQAQSAASRLCEQSGFACSSGSVKPWSGDMALPGQCSTHIQVSRTPGMYRYWG